MIVNKTDPVILTCHETANPTPSITWFKDGSLVGSADTLKFAIISRSEAAEYMCSVSNNSRVTRNANVYRHIQCVCKQICLVVIVRAT